MTVIAQQKHRIRPSWMRCFCRCRVNDRPSHLSLADRYLRCDVCLRCSLRTP